MQITIPKIVRPLPLNEYTADLGSQNLYVWVNPPHSKFQAYDDLWQAFRARLLASVEALKAKAKGKKTKEEEQKPAGIPAEDVESLKFDEQLREWYADLLAQGPAGTECTAAWLLEVAETDPAFSAWLQRSVWRLINEHRDGQKNS